MTRVSRFGRGLALPFTALWAYVVTSVSELRQVHWPSRAELIQYTTLTIVTIVVSVIFLTLFDYGLQSLTTRFLFR